MTFENPKAAPVGGATQGKKPKAADVGLAAEQRAALDHVQVSAVGDISESGKVVGGDRSTRKRGR
jgi:hypothetical protein